MAERYVWLVVDEYGSCPSDWSWWVVAAYDNAEAAYSHVRTQAIAGFRKSRPIRASKSVAREDIPVLLEKMIEGITESIDDDGSLILTTPKGQLIGCLGVKKHLLLSVPENSDA